MVGHCKLSWLVGFITLAMCDEHAVVLWLDLWVDLYRFQKNSFGHNCWVKGFEQI